MSDDNAPGVDSMDHFRRKKFRAFFYILEIKTTKTLSDLFEQNSLISIYLKNHKHKLVIDTLEFCP
jgi:hypothetical protein